MAGTGSSGKFDPLSDIVDLKGKVIIVTGGNKGIGYATVQHLARGGAKVYLAARDEGRAMKAIETLRQDGLGPGNGEVLWLKLDLSNPRDAKRAAEEFLKKETRLDVLGIYISPFVFTRTLLPLLTETAKEPNSDVRIVNLTSIVYKLASSKVSFEDMKDFNIRYQMHPSPAFQRYALSKLMVLLWSITLQKRISEANLSTPITVIALHPGGVDTFTHNWPFPAFSKWLVGLVIADPMRGAYNSVFAAASKTIASNKDRYRGKYLESAPTGRIAQTRLFYPEPSTSLFYAACMATQDKSKLLALAKSHLGYSTNDPDQVVPSAYLNRLLQHTLLHPHYINFRLTLEPGTGFGQVTCLEQGCNNPIIYLDRQSSLPDGGLRDGLGSLSAYCDHMYDMHVEDQRDKQRAVGILGSVMDHAVSDE
ncbi:hypothetical protein C0993_008279 [Termitomyces sp. T159_Od127]|nr:hypothetical protein C0993_008279 [Termitomyces sp. T159_Od127]